MSLVICHHCLLEQVFADKLNTKMKPIRAPSHWNYISLADFPYPYLPRYAAGNFYMLSADLVHFIAANATGSLGVVGTLEDVSVAVWLATIGVRRSVCVNV